MFGGFAVELVLDVEQRFGALDRFECDRRDGRRAVATPLGGRDVGEFVALPPTVRPAAGFGHWPRNPILIAPLPPRIHPAIDQAGSRENQHLG